MSVQTLYTAATGMQALETKLDVIANNLANVNTTGFKRGRANFEDLFYRHQVMPGAEDDGGGRTATGTSIGLGGEVTSIQTDFKQGAFQQTNNALDVAIEGPASSRCVTPTETRSTREPEISRSMPTATGARLGQHGATAGAEHHDSRGRSRHIHPARRKGARQTAGRHQLQRNRANRDGRLH